MTSTETATRGARAVWLIAAAFLASGCGASSTTSPTTRRSLRLVTVDERSVPVQLYADATTKSYGWVVSGTLLAPARGTNSCDLSLALNRTATRATDSTFTQTTETSCEWSADSTTATALVTLGGSWGTHTYRFAQ